jgi:hypothetical protein
MSQPSFLYDSRRFVFSTYIMNMIRNLIKFLFYIIYSVISTYLIFNIHPSQTKNSFYKRFDNFFVNLFKTYLIACFINYASCTNVIS